jgi:hypothetical protein
MFGKQDQVGIADAYGLVTEMHMSQGMPVIVSMDMPGAEIEHEDHLEGEHEHDSSEIEIAVAELHRISDQALMLKELVQSMEGLEGWVASKITKAADYISSAYNWLEYQQQGGDEGCGCSNDRSMHGSGYEDAEGCEYAAQGCKCGGCTDCN